MSRTSLAVQWLNLRASTAGGTGLDRELRSRMLRGAARKKKKKCVKMFLTEMIISKKGEKHCLLQ